MTGLDVHVGFTYAKVLTIIRVKNFYAANCKKVPYRYLQGTSRVGNLLFFVTKSNKFRNNAVTFSDTQPPGNQQDDMIGSHGKEVEPRSKIICGK